MLGANVASMPIADRPPMPPRTWLLGLSTGIGNAAAAASMAWPNAEQVNSTPAALVAAPYSASARIRRFNHLGKDAIPLTVETQRIIQDVGALRFRPQLTERLLHRFDRHSDGVDQCDACRHPDSFCSRGDRFAPGVIKRTSSAWSSATSPATAAAIAPAKPSYAQQKGQ